jgi:hypothetical protein
MAGSGFDEMMRRRHYENVNEPASLSLLGPLVASGVDETSRRRCLWEYKQNLLVWACLGHSHLISRASTRSCLFHSVSKTMCEHKLHNLYDIKVSRVSRVSKAKCRCLRNEIRNDKHFSCSCLFSPASCRWALYMLPLPPSRSMYVVEASDHILSPCAEIREDCIGRETKSVILVSFHAPG